MQSALIAVSWVLSLVAVTTAWPLIAPDMSDYPTFYDGPQPLQAYNPYEQAGPLGGLAPLPDFDNVYGGEQPAVDEPMSEFRVPEDLSRKRRQLGSGVGMGGASASAQAQSSASGMGMGGMGGMGGFGMGFPGLGMMGYPFGLMG